METDYKKRKVYYKRARWVFFISLGLAFIANTLVFISLGSVYKSITDSQNGLTLVANIFTDIKTTIATVNNATTAISKDVNVTECSKTFTKVGASDLKSDILTYSDAVSQVTKSINGVLDLVPNLVNNVSDESSCQLFLLGLMLLLSNVSYLIFHYIHCYCFC